MKAERWTCRLKKPGEFCTRENKRACKFKYCRKDMPKKEAHDE